MKTVIRFALPYLVFPSSFFSMPFSIGASFAGSPAFWSPPAGAAGSGAGTGSAGAGAGGGGGGGSSFLPHPAKVKVKAKSVINDNENIFLPILRFTSFPVTHLANLFWISLLYRTSLSDFQGQPQNYPSQPHHELRLGSRRILPLDDSWTITAQKFARPTSKNSPLSFLAASPNRFFITSDNSSAQSRISSPQIADRENSLHARALFQNKPRSITRPVKAEKISSRGKTLKKIPKELFSNKNFNAGAAAREPMVF